MMTFQQLHDFWLKKLDTVEITTARNPALTLWRQLFGNQNYNCNERFFNSEDPKFDIKEYMELSRNSMCLRDICSIKYAWAIPCDEAIQEIVKHSPIIEIGAGTGYWANLITQAGGGVAAYDVRPVNLKNNLFHPGAQPFFDVKVGNHKKIPQHPNCTLMLCWPPCHSKLTKKCLDLYRQDTLIYIGEYNTNSSWSEDLDDPSKWLLEKIIKIPQWQALHDEMFIFKRALHAGAGI
jgi:hypothetical protein